MRGISRLLEELRAGETQAIVILVAVVLVTAVIFLITQKIQRDRRKNK